MLRKEIFLWPTSITRRLIVTFLEYAVSNWRTRIHLDEASYNLLADSKQEMYIPGGTAEPVGVLLSNESSILPTMDFPLNITTSMQYG